MLFRASVGISSCSFERSATNSFGIKEPICRNHIPTNSKIHKSFHNGGLFDAWIATARILFQNMIEPLCSTNPFSDTCETVHQMGTKMSRNRSKRYKISFSEENGRKSVDSGFSVQAMSPFVSFGRKYFFISTMGVAGSQNLGRMDLK